MNEDNIPYTVYRIEHYSGEIEWTSAPILVNGRAKDLLYLVLRNSQNYEVLTNEEGFSEERALMMVEEERHDKSKKINRFLIA
jgi:hypothetical protein